MEGDTTALRPAVADAMSGIVRSVGDDNGDGSTPDTGSETRNDAVTSSPLL
jgi:hypothetical protein